MKTVLNPKGIKCIAAIIFFLLTFCACGNLKTSEESANFIKNPKVGDIYFVEKEKGVFTLMKISNITNDSVRFDLNKFSRTMASQIDATYNAVKFRRTASLNQSDYWSNSTKSYTKSALLDLYNNKFIYEIKRL